MTDAPIYAMISQEMARAIANMAVFLEFSSEDILDADASIQAMEQLASDLQALDRASQESLSNAFRLVAPGYRAELNKFVEDLPGALGLE